MYSRRCNRNHELCMSTTYKPPKVIAVLLNNSHIDHVYKMIHKTVKNMF